jgi:TrmH family RNA methyltransferase
MLSKSQIKYIQSLGHKKFRDQERAFIVEGPKMVREMLNSPNTRPIHIYAVAEFTDAVIGDHLLTRIREPELERISSLVTPNQVLAVFEKPGFPPPQWTNSISLLLDGIQDPGNLGTIVRIADWFGIPQVVCSSSTSDIFNAKAVQATMGSISRVHVLYEEPETLIRKYPELPAYAAVLDGRNLYHMERVHRGMIVIGNESRGIRGELLKLVAHPVTIPRIGQAESLNAAVAAGIILSHLVPGG